MNINNNKKIVSEINVTPFVDVVLVLLIIFMITAPLMYSGIQLQLPVTKKVNSIHLQSSQIIISLSRTGELYLGKNKILFDELASEVSNHLKKQQDKTVYIRAHWEIEYGKVAVLMGYLKSKNITQIALITENEHE